MRDSERLAVSEPATYSRTSATRSELPLPQGQPVLPALPPVTGRASFPVLGYAVPLPPSLRALGHRNFRLFWTGQLISLVGTWMQTVARGWLVLELTHSAFWLGMVGFASSVPVLVLSLWGGAVVDSVAKRTLIVWTQVVQMVMAFVLAALTWTGTVDVWHVIAISLILGAVLAFDAPGRQAFTMEMVGKEDLMNAVALNSSIFNGARVLGPAIGAIALAWEGPALAFFLNGVSFIAVIIGLLMMRLPQFERKQQTVGTRDRIVEGLSYVRHNTTIGALMLIVAVTSVFAFPYTMLMPVFADDVLHVGQGGYGTLLAFSGIGSLLGALTLTIQSGKSTVRRGRIIMLGALLMPVFVCVFSISLNYAVALAMLIGIGYTMISVNATTNTVIQTNVPDELRGRVNGVFSFLFIGMAPFGNIQAGLLADHFGAPAALFIGGLVCALATLAILVRKRDLLQLS